MKTFSEKIKEAREELKLNQQQLGELVGVSKRSIAAYETTDTKPRGNIARKLAAALQVSVDYLLNDEIIDPKYGIEKAPYIEEARERLGPKAAKEMDVLLEQNVALFAGGALDQDFLELVAARMKNLAENRIPIEKRSIQLSYKRIKKFSTEE